MRVDKSVKIHPRVAQRLVTQEVKHKKNEVNKIAKEKTQLSALGGG